MSHRLDRFYVEGSDISRGKNGKKMEKKFIKCIRLFSYVREKYREISLLRFFKFHTYNFTTL